MAKWIFWGAKATKSGTSGGDLADIFLKRIEGHYMQQGGWKSKRPSLISAVSTRRPRAERTKVTFGAVRCEGRRRREVALGAKQAALASAERLVSACREEAI